jgi:hypothetical protein
MFPYLGTARFSLQFQKILRRHQHARRAIATLQGVAFPKRVLQIGYFTAVGQTFYRLHGAAMRLHRKHQASANDLAVHPNRARAAHAMFAADVCTGQAKLDAEKVAQKQARFDVAFVETAVHLDANSHPIEGFLIDGHGLLWHRGGSHRSRTAELRPF